MSEVNVNEIKTLNGYPLADTKARADIAALTAELKGSDEVEITGAFVDAEMQYGDSVTALKTVVERPYGEGGRYSNVAYLYHVCGANLFDFVGMFGGEGIYEKNGVTMEINGNGTARISGTASADTNFWGGDKIFDPIKIVPKGTYSIGNGLTLAFNRFDSASTMIKKQTGGTITLDEPAYLTQMYINVAPGATVDFTAQLALVRGTVMPDSGLGYEGEIFRLGSEELMTDGRVVDWINGEILDTDGSVVASITPRSVKAYSGENTFFSGNGIVTINYEKSSAPVIPTIDHTAWGLPVLELYGDTSTMTKDNAVTLNYRYGWRTGTCEVKWQGSSSLSWPKKNYTIKFDNDFEAKEGWGKQKKYCFKANFIDHSHARNIVSCMLWGQVVKSRATPNATLNALPNGGAIDGFPCVILLNDKFHGLYTWNIPKDGWMFGMGSGTNEAIVCADGYSPGTTFTGDATLNGDFELEHVSDEDNADWVLTSLNRLINAVAGSDGSDLDTTIAQYLDWDSAIDYYIYNVLEQGTDAMDKNYILATYDGVKWFFSAYDRDTVYGLEWHGKSFKKAGTQVRFQDFAGRNRAMLLVRDYKRDALKARYAELRETVLSEDNVASVFSNFIAKIPAPLYNADVEKWQTIPSSAVSNLSQIVNWYRLRVAACDKEIEAL